MTQKFNITFSSHPIDNWSLNPGSAMQYFCDLCQFLPFYVSFFSSKNNDKNRIFFLAFGEILNEKMRA